MSKSISLAENLYEQLTDEKKEFLPQIPRLDEGRGFYDVQDLGQFRFSLYQVLNSHVDDKEFPTDVLELVASLCTSIDSELGLSQVVTHHGYIY